MNLRDYIKNELIEWQRATGYNGDDAHVIATYLIEEALDVLVMRSLGGDKRYSGCYINTGGLKIDTFRKEAHVINYNSAGTVDPIAISDDIYNAIDEIADELSS